MSIRTPLGLPLCVMTIGLRLSLSERSSSTVLVLMSVTDFRSYSIRIATLLTIDFASRLLLKAGPVRGGPSGSRQRVLELWRTVLRAGAGRDVRGREAPAPNRQSGWIQGN